MCGLLTSDIFRASSWGYQMETFSALLTLCAGNSPVSSEFPSQRPVTRSFDIFFDPRLNKRVSKHSRRGWFETPPCSSWRHCTGYCVRYGKFGRKIAMSWPDSIVLTRPLSHMSDWTPWWWSIAMPTHNAAWHTRAGNTNRHSIVSEKIWKWWTILDIMFWALNCP